MKNGNEKCNNEKKKKGILAMIWESMTKTGGCCGSGGNCGCGANPNKSKTESANMDEQKNEQSK